MPRTDSGLPDNDLLRVDTIHAGLAIYREEEALVMHSPPNVLRQYDAILIDECSQLDDDLCKKLVYALDSLPQLPFVGVAADFCQLQPVGAGGIMHRWCESITKKIVLRTIHRTKDMDLLNFLRLMSDGSA